MFKRVVLAVTFVAALGAAGLGMSGPAMAGHVLASARVTGTYTLNPSVK